MKILYVHQFFKYPNEPGGTRSYDLASSFVQNGFEVTVISATSDPTYNTNKKWVQIERDGIQVHYIYLPYGNQLSYFKRSIVFLRFLWYSSFLLLRLKGDLVLATSTPLTIGIPALIKKWFGGVPFIFEVRDVWPEAVIAIGAIKNKIIQFVLKFLEWLIYKNASAIIPLSTDMNHSIVSRYPQFSSKPIRVIENISEVSRFQNEVELVDLEEVIGFKPRFSVLYAGTFGRVNGIDYVIDLAARTFLIDPELVYLLIGRGRARRGAIAGARVAAGACG